jgi:hypothetical protein
VKKLQAVCIVGRRVIGFGQFETFRFGREQNR